MLLLKRWRRWSARLLRVGCLAAALALTPGVARAQVETTRAEAEAKIHYTKNPSFHLPIQMTPTARADTREICLYVKQAGSDWVRIEQAAPTAMYFTPKVTRDGEYWFTLVTVSKAGKATPPDVAKAPPGLRVVVDTTAPAIDVQPAATSTSDFCLRCSATDPNLDPASLKAVARTDKGDRPLDPVPGMPGCFRAPTPDLMSFPVRVSAADRAGNVGAKDVNVRDLVMAAMKARPEEVARTAHKTPVPPPTSIVPDLPAKRVDTPPAIPVSALPPAPTTVSALSPAPTTASPAPTAIGALPPAPSAVGTAPPASSVPPAFPPASTPPPSGGAPGSAIPAPAPLIPPPAPLMPPAFPPLTDPAIHKTAASDTAPTLPHVTGEGKYGVPRQIVNTTQVSVDYRIDHVGPSGVGRVDVYVTSDNGQSWKKVKETTDHRNPSAEVDLPGEGLYGVKLVITNGNGFGGTPPVRGEQPTCWIEVDTTAPQIRLQPVEPVAQNGFLEIRWTASDANLGAEPIGLYFRTRPESPWQPIARNLKNDGSYRWAFPRDLGAQFWIKAEVTDQAGNVSRSETPNPVLLDMTEPRVQVLGVSGVSVRPSGH